LRNSNSFVAVRNGSLSMRMRWMTVLTDYVSGSTVVRSCATQR
jgi:hypothetical protein